MTEATGHWKRCRHWIAAACEYANGAVTIEDIEEGIEAGRYHFWPGKKCAAITQLVEYPRATFLHVPFAGGDDIDELVAMVPSFMSWGKYLGASKVTLTGRAGWERVLKPSGWEKTAVCLSLPIPPEIKQ